MLVNLKSSPRIDDFKYLLFYWYLICSPQGRFSSNYLSKIYLQTLSSYLLSRTHSCVLVYALPIFLFIVKPLYITSYNEPFPLHKTSIIKYHKLTNSINLTLIKLSTKHIIDKSTNKWNTLLNNRKTTMNQSITIDKITLIN